MTRASGRARRSFDSEYELLVRSLVATASLGLLVLGCTPPPPPLQLPVGCQPLLAGADCILPFPSDAFRVPDAQQPSGFRISLPADVAPRTKDGKRFDVTAELPIDGFSTVPTIVATLGVEVSPSRFVRLEDGGGPSLSKDTSNTLLLDAETGKPVPHFVDLDPRAKDPTRQAIVLHPFVGLEPRRRYVVLFAGITQPSGELAPAPEGFRRLRDGLTGQDAAFTTVRTGFEDRIVPLARAAGVDRASLQLAWEFTTGSHEWATRDLFRVRELTLAWLDANPPVVTIRSVDDAPYADTARVIRGTVTAPRFCSNGAVAGCTLLRDADGQVQQDGTVEVPFLAVVPATVVAASGPSSALLYGHGFFGTLAELEAESTRRIASEARRTLVGVEWWGMHFTDVAIVGDALTSHPSQATRFTERVHQAMANWLVVTRAVEVFGALPAFQRASGAPLVAGPADAFMGISQGHILGGTMNALNPTTRRIALEVGGAGLTTMMMRAEAFETLFDFLSFTVDEPLEVQRLVAMLQRPLDRIDPATYARHLLREPLPGNAPKQVLMQVGLMDVAVPNVGSFLHARLIGLPLLTPTPYQPFGLEETSYPAANGLQLHDFKLGDPDTFYRRADFPTVSTPVHEGVRVQAPVLRQLSRFFADGVIEQTCSGVCDPD